MPGSSRAISESTRRWRRRARRVCTPAVTRTATSTASRVRARDHRERVPEVPRVASGFLPLAKAASPWITPLSYGVTA
ncbi:hypothetical protein GCM10020219_057650 [Nonomuraea dietziae]